jgi:hypothetical protein
MYIENLALQKRALARDYPSNHLAHHTQTTQTALQYPYFELTSRDQNISPGGIYVKATFPLVGLK